MISIASSSGTRHATPSMNVVAVSVGTTRPASNDSFVDGACSATTPMISRAQAEQVADADEAADPRTLADRHVDGVELGRRAEELPGVRGDTE